MMIGLYSLLQGVKKVRFVFLQNCDEKFASFTLYLTV